MSWDNRIVGEGTENPEQLLANPFNYRRHPAEQLDALQGALDEIGWIQRVIVNQQTGHMIDGHARVELAIRSGQDEVPVLYVDLDENEERIALAVLDPISGLAYHDQDQLDELIGLIETENDALAGFLDDLAGGDDSKEVPKTNEDDAPAPDDSLHVSQPGDIWQLGQHRLMCGDATDGRQIKTLMGDDTADLVWTDPPYGVSYEAKVESVSKGGKRRANHIENDELQGDDLYRFLRDAFSAIEPVTKPGGCIYVAHAETEAISFRTALTDAGWLYKQTLVWVKNALVLSRQDYNWRHEPIMYGWKPGAAHYFIEDFSNQTVLEEDGDIEEMSKEELLEIVRRIQAMPSTTINIDKPSRSELHPTMKPVKLVAKFLHNSSRVGEVVLDPFGGSGTTLIAAHQLDRCARIMELSPEYVDVIVKRWQEFAGKQAILERTGETFDELMTRAEKARAA